MKKLLTIALSLSLFTFGANAQVARSQNRAQKMQSDSTHKNAMMKDLNLTADQKSQMKELRENGKQQREALKNDATLSADQKREKMKEISQSQQDKMNAILTPDQKAKWDADKKQWQGKNQAQKMKGKRFRNSADSTKSE